MRGFTLPHPGLLAAFGVLLLICLFPGLMAQPVAFLTGWPLLAIQRAELTALLAVGALVLAGFVRRDFVHGVLERRAGKALPLLLGDIASALVLLAAAILVLTGVYGRDLTAVLATGGLGLAVLGIALRDVILSVFNAAALNVENVFEVGDRVKIGDVEGVVIQTTWRSTTLRTSALRHVSLPNTVLGASTITNYDRPDRGEQRSLELCLDYSVNVESAERILLAGVLGAEGVSLGGAPKVYATRLEKDGVIYSVSYTVVSNADAMAADHAVIRSILSRLRDAGTGISYPKTEVVNAERRIGIADRALDRYLLIRQCELFRDLPEPVRQRLADTLEERQFASGAQIVQAGERRASLFIVGEGMVRRFRARSDTIQMREERFVATQVFGRRALLADLPHPGLTTAATASVIFELSQDALRTILAEFPDSKRVLAATLARASARQSDAELSEASAANPWNGEHFYANILDSLNLH